MLGSEPSTPTMIARIRPGSCGHRYQWPRERVKATTNTTRMEEKPLVSSVTRACRDQPPRLAVEMDDEEIHEDEPEDEPGSEEGNERYERPDEARRSLL